jgi:hypothetical protein
MEFGALIRVLRKSHPYGWSSLQKTSRLTEQEVIEAALATYNEMVNK